MRDTGGVAYAGERGVPGNVGVDVRRGEGTAGILIGFAWVRVGLGIGTKGTGGGNGEFGVVGYASCFTRTFTGVADNSGGGVLGGTVFSPCPPFSSFVRSAGPLCFAFATRVCFSKSTVVAGSASPVEGRLLACWNADTACFVIGLGAL
jgi:hypothetical protein